MKRILKILLFLIILAIAAFAGYLFLGEEENRDIYTFIPDDFIYVIESDRPVDDWKDLSRSEVWKFLKTNEFFGDIASSTNMLDTMLLENELFTKFIKLGDLVISAHMIGSSEYEFVILVDMKGLSKLSKVGAGLNAFFQSLEYEVSQDDYFGHTVWDLKDPTTGDVISISQLSNVLVVSYDKSLLKSAINQTEKSPILSNSDFAKVHDDLGKNDIYSIFLNYNLLEKYMAIYTDELPESLNGINEILSFSSFDLNLGDDHTFLKGFTKQVDTVPSFLNVFKEVGRGKMLAKEVLPASTAFYSSLGFDDFDDLFKKFEAFYEEQTPEEYADFAKNKNKIEGFLKFDFEEDFFKWMTEEVVTAVVPIDEAKSKYAYFGMFHFDDYDLAKEKMDFFAERIRKRSPAKFLEVEYKGVPIRYLELKGFFKIFLKKMFANIEKPHYAFVGDYVVFSNDTVSLQYLIDANISNPPMTLDRDLVYKDFEDNFESKSNVFAYINNINLYNYLLSSMDASYRADLAKNKEYLLAFPQIGFQLYPGNGMYKTLLYAEFQPPEAVE